MILSSGFYVDLRYLDQAILDDGKLILVVVAAPIS